jgi:5'(3')-deoxyribonucleotidase
MNKTIFLDMDGVVADWQSFVKSVVGRDLPEGQRWPDEDWRQLIQIQRIYRDLQPLPYAQELVARVLALAQVSQYEVKFLTAVPRRNDFPYAFEDKVHWANNHFPGIPVWFGPYSQDKQRRAAPGQVLIDDRITNINEWRAAGGYGIHHTGDFQTTLQDLREFLQVGP